MVGKRRPTAGTICHHLESLVQQPALPIIFQDPPDALDILIFVRDICCVQVHPVPNPVSQPFPFLDIRKSGLPAKLIETIDAVFLNLLFIGKAQLLLHFNFHRQTMGIPAASPADMVSTHGFVARENVLECTRQDMVNTGSPIRSWRTFKENIFLSPFPLLHGFMEDVMGFPKSQNTFLQDCDIEFWGYGFKHSTSKKLQRC